MLNREAREENEHDALHRRLREYAHHRATLDAAEGFDLVRAEQIKLYLFHGYVTHYEYMERVLGYGPHAARERMRVARALVSLPVISAQLAKGRLTFSAVRELTRVATPDTEAEWLASTNEMTAHQIEQAVAGHARGDRPDDPKPPDTRTRKITMQLPPEVYAQWRQARVALEEERGGEVSDIDFVEAMCRRILEPGTGADSPAHQIAYKQCPDCKAATQNGAGLELGIMPEVLERAGCDARFIGSLDAPAPERATTSVTPRVREQVFARDNFCCTVPGCRSRRNLEIHHLHPQADGGTHELWNLTLICGGHHAALHAGLLQMIGRAPYEIRFRWTYGQPLPPGLDGTQRFAMIQARASRIIDAYGEWSSVPRGTGPEEPVPLAARRKDE